MFGRPRKPKLIDETYKEKTAEQWYDYYKMEIEAGSRRSEYTARLENELRSLRAEYMAFQRDVMLVRGGTE